MKKIKNKDLILMTVMSFGIFGCASYRHPETINDKMARFMPRDTNPNQVPPLAIPTDVKSKRPSRGIASVGSNSSESRQDENENSEELKLSHKRLYFMGLYQQYRTLGKFVSEEQVPEIQHCPSFHTTLLNGKTGYRENQKSKLDFKKRYSSIHDAKKAYYPELFLPMAPDSTVPTLGEVVKSDQDLDKNMAFQQALKVHLTKTYKELEELCDTGSSSNYYNFENLGRHIKSNQMSYKQSPEALRTLYKTTIFSNMALIESLETPMASERKATRGPASVSTAKKWDNIYQDHMVKDLNLNWTKHFLKKAMSNR